MEKYSHYPFGAWDLMHVNFPHVQVGSPQELVYEDKSHSLEQAHHSR